MRHFLLLSATLVLEALLISAMAVPELKKVKEEKDKYPQKTTWFETGITLKPAEVKAKSIQTAIKVAAEGVVLLKNDNNALALKAAKGTASTRQTIFMFTPCHLRILK